MSDKRERAAYARAYYAANRARIRARANELKQRPEAKERTRIWNRAYAQRPAVRAKRLAGKRAWYQRNIERERSKDRSPKERERKRLWMREVGRFKRYGLTRAMFDEYLDAQEGCCAFCGNALPEHVSIDHDHATGQYRGIVHQRCNWVIGQAETDDRYIAYMAAAAL